MQRKVWKGQSISIIRFISIQNHRQYQEAIPIQQSKSSEKSLCRETAWSNVAISAHARAGRVGEARVVFDCMPRRDIVSWNSMIAAYSRNGLPDRARNAFDHMPARDVVSWNTLVVAYARSGRMEDARAIFDAMPARDAVSWNSIITAYARNGLPEETLAMFFHCQQRCTLENEGVTAVKLSMAAFVSSLGACAKLGDLPRVKMIHASMVDSGITLDIIILSNALVDAYVKCCGGLRFAVCVFENMPRRDVSSWTTLIAAYARQGDAWTSLALFQHMVEEGVKPDKVAFVSIVDACARLADLGQAKRIHASIDRHGFGSDIMVGNALINMYGKCGSVEDANTVFWGMPMQDLVSWNAMIGAYAHNGEAEAARNVFDRMPERDSVSWNAMMTACAQSGKLQDARDVFEHMPHQTLVSWNAIIAAYAHNGHCKEALELYQRMELESTRKPDSITFISALDACAAHAALTQGKKIHGRIVSVGSSVSDTMVVVANALIHMYGKCGSLEDAWRVFNTMPRWDLVSWNAMIAAYAQNGQGEKALHLFQQMALERVKPDVVTFIGVLSACGHVGLLHDGMCRFVSMFKDHGIIPTSKHYVCMAHIFGQAGRLDEAEGLINDMPFELPFEAIAIVWRCLLSACRIHGDIERSMHAANHLFELDPTISTSYLPLWNTCREDDVAKVGYAMEDLVAKRQPGQSSIEINNRVHEFAMGDLSHPQVERIHLEMHRLGSLMKEAGYVLDPKALLDNVEKKEKEKEKEHRLSYHSEKLAIAFGIISTPPGTTLRIVKDLWVCSDCHVAIKFISKVVERKIIVRDAYRFHHFESGICSCGDYW